jgi:translation initiation factor 4A
LQIYNIILHLPKKIQVGLFSATYANEAIQTSYRLFMDKPVELIVPRDEELKNVKQYYLTVENEELKLGKLYDLFKITGVEQRLVVFVNTKDKAVSLAKDVGKHYTVSASHDGMDQRARAMAIQKLKSRSSSILITTDHRGTNAIPQVPIIINYDIPTESMRYVRRLQQQNRQFRQPLSVVINLVSPADRRTLAAITRFCNRSVGELPSDLKI